MTIMVNPPSSIPYTLTDVHEWLDRAVENPAHREESARWELANRIFWRIQASIPLKIRQHLREKIAAAGTILDILNIHYVQKLIATDSHNVLRPFIVQNGISLEIAATTKLTDQYWERVDLFYANHHFDRMTRRAKPA